jgi:hypothetical protein
MCVFALQVVTINGARISRDKHDIPIPQGIAHAVDRVMFPLPVGNIIQTLRSDRERRFTKFLRAVQTSGLAESFTGNPSRAFQNLARDSYRRWLLLGRHNEWWPRRSQSKSPLPWKPQISLTLLPACQWLTRERDHSFLYESTILLWEVIIYSFYKKTPLSIGTLNFIFLGYNTNSRVESSVGWGEASAEN